MRLTSRLSFFAAAALVAASIGVGASSAVAAEATPGVGFSGFTAVDAQSAQYPDGSIRVKFHADLINGSTAGKLLLNCDQGLPGTVCSEEMPVTGPMDYDQTFPADAGTVLVALYLSDVANSSTYATVSSVIVVNVAKVPVVVDPPAIRYVTPEVPTLIDLTLTIPGAGDCDYYYVIDGVEVTGIRELKVGETVKVFAVSGKTCVVTGDVGPWTFSSDADSNNNPHPETPPVVTPPVVTPPVVTPPVVTPPVVVAPVVTPPAVKAPVVTPPTANANKLPSAHTDGGDLVATGFNSNPSGWLAMLAVAFGLAAVITPFVRKRRVTQ